MVMLERWLFSSDSPNPKAIYFLVSLMWREYKSPDFKKKYTIFHEIMIYDNTTSP